MWPHGSPGKGMGVVGVGAGGQTGLRLVGESWKTAGVVGGEALRRQHSSQQTPLGALDTVGGDSRPEGPQRYWPDHSASVWPLALV